MVLYGSIYNWIIGVEKSEIHSLFLSPLFVFLFGILAYELGLELQRYNGVMDCREDELPGLIRACALKMLLFAAAGFWHLVLKLCSYSYDIPTNWWGMGATASGASALNLSSSAAGGDPLQLVTLTGIYRTRASFHAAIRAWKSLVLHGLRLLWYFLRAGFSYASQSSRRFASNSAGWDDSAERYFVSSPPPPPLCPCPLQYYSPELQDRRGKTRQQTRHGHPKRTTRTYHPSL